jgi:hypothetical protein
MILLTVNNNLHLSKLHSPVAKLFVPRSKTGSFISAAPTLAAAKILSRHAFYGAFRRFLPAGTPLYPAAATSGQPLAG